jgi:hypothetical protein
LEPLEVVAALLGAGVKFLAGVGAASLALVATGIALLYRGLRWKP